MKLEKARLSNGLTVLYQQATDLPLATGTLLIRSGASGDRSERAGLCQLGTQMLFQGTARHNAKALANRLESMGSAMGAHASDDYSEFGFLVPEGEVCSALTIAGQLFTRATFPKSELEKEQAHTVAALQSRRDAIFNLAHDAMMQGLYGDHPYGRLTEGSPESVKAVQQNDLHAWRSSRWVPANAVFSIVAGLSWRQMRNHLEATFRSWKSAPVATATSLAGSLPERAENQRKELSAKFEQSYLMTGLIAPRAADADALPLKVLNTIVGGGMSSRLFVQLREERGLAYDVSSFFPTRMHPSHWVFYLGCSPENLNTAESVLQEVLQKLADQGVTSTEVRQAKAMMRGQFISDHQTRRRRAWYAAWWEFMGRGAAYDQQFLPRLEKITTNEVSQLAKKLLARPRLTVRISPS